MASNIKDILSTTTSFRASSLQFDCLTIICGVQMTRLTFPRKKWHPNLKVYQPKNLRVHGTEQYLDC
jgi:hypothetical protein